MSATHGRGTQAYVRQIGIGQETALALVFQGLEEREANFLYGHERRFHPQEVGDLCHRYNLRLGMRVLVIGRRVRVYNHYPIDIVDMGKHRNARLICHEQCKQHQGDEYVPSIWHLLLKNGCKSSFFSLIKQINQ